jgi:hypothetical protein
MGSHALGWESIPMNSSFTRTTTLKRTGMKRKPLGQREPVLKSTSKLKSRSIKGRAPTVAERERMDKIAEIGCIACFHEGIYNPHVSLHHIDGRTKPDAHMLVLPLCAPHHQQDDTDPLQRPSVHGRKKTFTARYGTEMELLAECLVLIGETA